MSSWNQDIYIKTLIFAATAHGSQKVPGTELPYLTHVTLVTMEVIAALSHDENLDGDLAVQCALLHDVIEDTDITFQQVVDTFGPAVADGVLALTKNEAMDKLSAMQDSLERIRKQPREVWLVKLADRITNLQPPPHYWTVEKKIAYRQEAQVIHDALNEASPYLAARLREKIDAYGVYLTKGA